MSEAGEAKARRTPARAGRSQGPKGASASNGGGRHAEASGMMCSREAARRRASARRRNVALSSSQPRAEAPVSETAEAKARSAR